MLLLGAAALVVGVLTLVFGTRHGSSPLEPASSGISTKRIGTSAIGHGASMQPESEDRVSNGGFSPKKR